MEILNFIFRLGVVFAIFSFLWGIFELGLNLITAGRQKTVREIYFQKSVKYIMLAMVTFMMSTSELSHGNRVMLYFTVGGIVLLTYFLGRYQSGQMRQMIRIQFNQFQPMQTVFNYRGEWIALGLGIVTYLGLLAFPNFAENVVSRWFVSSILDIEDTPVFGFIFKIFGFFFVVNLFFKFINGISVILSGGQIGPRSNDFKRSKEEDNDFTDFEEVEDDK